MIYPKIEFETHDRKCISATMLHDFVIWLQSASHHRPLAFVTIREYERQIKAFARWLVDDLGLTWEPDTISPHRMHAYVHYLQFMLQYAPATQLKAISALKAFGTWLVETDQFLVNPARHLRAQGEQPSAIKVLSGRIMQRMVDAAHHTGDLRDAVVVELLASSGMRSSEIAGIQIENLERGERTMWVKIIGKGAKRRRLPLPKHVGELIDAYLEERILRSGMSILSGPLLIGQRGGITRTTINDIVASVANRANLTDAQRAMITPHAFRHTVATALVRRRDIVTAADILGHTNINTTRRYAKASTQELEQAINMLSIPSAIATRDPLEEHHE